MCSTPCCSLVVLLDDPVSNRLTRCIACVVPSLFAYPINTRFLLTLDEVLFVIFLCLGRAHFDGCGCVGHRFQFCSLHSPLLSKVCLHHVL